MKPTKITDFKVGQTITYKNPFMNGTTEGYVVFCDETDRYPISDSEGNKSRSLGRNEEGILEFLTPENEGLEPNAKIIEVMISDKMGGSLNIKETEFKEVIRNFEVEITDKPIDNNLVKVNDFMNKMFKNF